MSGTVLARGRSGNRPAPQTRSDPASSGAQRTEAERGLVRVITINTHRGEGPKLPYLLDGAEAAEAERIRLLHDTRAYAYHIADWVRHRQDRYHVIGLQEVFDGSLLSPRRWMPWRARQRDFYRVVSGYGASISHSVGFAGFRYENVLLSRLRSAPLERIQKHLPCRVFRLAACGFTLAPFDVDGRTVWIGNTHLHAYNPRARARQAASIAREIRALGDVPVLFMGDINTVPPGCKDGDFPHGDRDVNSYRGDRTFGLLERAGLHTVAHADDVERWTYPTGIPNRTLDYVFASRHFDVLDYRVVREFTLSDHYPVEATVRLVR